MAQYLCLITVLSDAGGGPPQPPLGIWGPTDPRPTNPIVVPPGGAYPGGPPPVAGWPGGLPGGGGFPGQGGPVDPGYSPPWATPRPPVAGWPGGLPGGGGFPGQGGPVDPGYGIDAGLRPTHPIYFPPPGGQPPLGIWGPTDPRPTNPIAGIPGLPGSPGQQPHPEHPIVLPPDLPPELPSVGKVDWKTAWTPQTGWIIVGVPAEGTLVPTPS